MAEQRSVSIITPCYNGERYLRETLESVLAQTYQPIESIVIDDGSTDGSAAIAESFGPPVTLIRQQNQGESVARNQGIAIATGSHLLFLDADDLLHPEAVERMLASVGDDDRAVALMGYSTFLEDDRTPLMTHQPPAGEFLSTIISRNPGAPHCYLTPAEIVREANGFCDDLVYFEDWDFWCQVALTGAPLVPVDFVGAYYRRHPHAQTPSANKADRKLGHVVVMQRMIAGLRDRPALLERHGKQAFWAGWAALRSARDLGIGWSELRPLTDQMQALLKQGPQALRRSKFGRLARWLGLPLAMTVQGRRAGLPESEQKLLTQLQTMRDAEPIDA